MRDSVGGAIVHKKKDPAEHRAFSPLRKTNTACLNYKTFYHLSFVKNETPPSILTWSHLSANLSHSQRPK
jgi:hypothetical protein